VVRENGALVQCARIPFSRITTRTNIYHIFGLREYSTLSTENARDLGP
jgi:hypothetical protein